MIDLAEIGRSLIIALIGAVPTALVIYIGVVKGTEKTVDTAINKVMSRFGESPTAKRLFKMMESFDKIVGDDQAIEQVTKFFKEATDLVSSKEAKNFFKNVSALMLTLTENDYVKNDESENKILKLPKKKEVE